MDSPGALGGLSVIPHQVKTVSEASPMGRTGFPGILRYRKTVSVGILRAEVGFRGSPEGRDVFPGEF